MCLKHLFITLFILINLHVINTKVALQIEHFHSKTGAPSNYGNLIIENRFPILLIPGNGGSRMEAKLNKPSTVNPVCKKKTDDYYSLWLNLSNFVPLLRDCWADNVRMIYNMTTHTTSNSPGVDIRIPDFGNTTSIEYLDPKFKSVTIYYHELVEVLVAAGYTRGVDLMGAPYDFRKAPNEMSDYYKNVQKLIETSYGKFGKKCVIICHSMGCLNMLYFLNHQSQEWKDKYIQTFITLAGAWGGSVKAMKAFTSGDNLGVVVLPDMKAFPAERHFPSLAYLLPSDKFWPHDHVLASIKDINVTTANYKEFFAATDNLIGYEMWKDVRNLTYNLEPPGVEVHCLHGTGVETMAYLDYRHTNFILHQPKMTYGEGDGTVNEISLKGCLRWIDQQNQQIYYKSFENVKHLKMLSDSNVAQYILAILSHNY